MSFNFEKAKPVWPSGLSNEMNIFASFRHVFVDEGAVRLNVTASCLYRVYLNNEFIGYGPVAAAHGYFRIDTWDLTDKIKTGDNVLYIEVAGYNINSFYTLDQQSFFQAELLEEENVIAATGQDGQFDCRVVSERLQKVQKYSFQRPFIEYYCFDTSYTDRRRIGVRSDCSDVEIQDDKLYLPRSISYPNFKRVRPTLMSSGSIHHIDHPGELWRDRSLVNIGPKQKGFEIDQLEKIVSDDLQRLLYQPDTRPLEISQQGYEIHCDKYLTFKFDRNRTGFISLKVECQEPTHIVIQFDEVLIDGDIDFKRMQTVNAVSYELEPGTYELDSFEAYVLQCAKIVVLKGSCRLHEISLIEYANPIDIPEDISGRDDVLSKIKVAAYETLRQNTMGNFIDCPSRERAGWLCDSFFTARVYQSVTGDTSLEKNFIGNFILPKSFECLPKGMLPMCYPADHYDGVFIPNWAMWFVLEVADYYQRTGDRELVEKAKIRISELIDYFKSYENSDGLLEDLEGWVFVDWSKANDEDFVKGVNYPTNMLYALMLKAAGDLYGDETLKNKATEIKKSILTQSFNGQFFVDNAIHQDGKLVLTDNISEAGQYYAFFCDIITPQSHRQLWDLLVSEFGYGRDYNSKYPQVCDSNLLVGLTLRLDLLLRYGVDKQRIEQEIIDLYGQMAKSTGTLWEHKTATEASQNHGFASYVLCLI